MFPERIDQTVDIPGTGNILLDKAFALYRDALNRIGLPWLITPDPDKDFSARQVGLRLDPGGIALIKTTPLRTERGHHEIANSIDIQADSICAAYIIFGEALVQQSGLDVVGSPGDVMIFDHAEPVRIRQRSTGSFDALVLNIPKSKFANVRNANALFRNHAISAGQMKRPLSTCLRSLGEQMKTASSDELVSLYEASAVLLPTAACRLADNEFVNERELLRPRFREILQFINANIDNSELSPRWVADRVGMSARHVHRQFALMGITFGVYVKNKRVERVCGDLSSEEFRKMPISDIAFRWGFADLSSFNRVFKRKFGCTPREYRLRY